MCTFVLPFLLSKKIFQSQLYPEGSYSYATDFHRSFSYVYFSSVKMLYSLNSDNVFLLNIFLHNYNIFYILSVSLSSVEWEECFKLVWGKVSHLCNNIQFHKLRGHSHNFSPFSDLTLCTTPLPGCHFMSKLTWPA